MSKYFGTDGFRGEAGITLTADHAYKVGRFLGWYYNALYRQPLPQQETTDRYHEPDPDGVEEPAGYRTRPYL